MLRITRSRAQRHRAGAGNLADAHSGNFRRLIIQGMTAFDPTLIENDIHIGWPLGRNAGPGLTGAARRRAQNAVRDEGMVCHVGSHQARSCLAPLAERTRGVLHPGRRPTRFRVAQEHETEHDADFRAAINLRHVR